MSLFWLITFVIPFNSSDLISVITPPDPQYRFLFVLRSLLNMLYPSIITLSLSVSHVSCRQKMSKLSTNLITSLELNFLATHP